MTNKSTTWADLRGRQLSSPIRHSSFVTRHSPSTGAVYESFRPLPPLDLGPPLPDRRAADRAGGRQLQCGAADRAVSADLGGGGQAGQRQQYWQRAAGVAGRV